MKVLFSILLIMLVACASMKQQGSEMNGKILVHQPYCGGAKPTPDMAKGSYTPYKSAGFYIKSEMNHDVKKSTLTKIMTNDKGEFTVKLKPGKYILIHEDKTLAFEDYVKKYNTPSKNQEYIGEKDALREYNSPDMEILVEEGKIIEITYQAQCFVGINRLLKYTGPKPQ